jgi:hypothetical protein
VPDDSYDKDKKKPLRNRGLVGCEVLLLDVTIGCCFYGLALWFKTKIIGLALFEAKPFPSGCCHAVKVLIYSKS